MLQKSIFVVALLAVAITQSLAVNCDLRCSLMEEALGNRSCGQHTPVTMGHEQAEHCHGMSMQAGNEAAALIGGHRCESTVCKAALVAILKSSGADESLLDPTSVALLTPLPLLASDPTFRFTAFGHVHRQARNTPLDVRPGSSLRI